MASGKVLCMIQLEQELHNDNKPSFHITPVTDHQFKVALQIPRGLTYFVGHFPQFPVLPAVALLDITSFLTIKTFGLPPQSKLHKVVLLKIAAGVQPMQQVEIEISRELSEQSGTTFKALWTSTEKTKISELTFSY